MISFYLLNFHSSFWICIHNHINFHIFDNYENESKSNAFLPFFAKEWSFVSRLPTCLKDNKQIRDKKLTIIISKRKNGVILTQLKDISTNPLRSSFKPCCTLICGKSRARKIAKFLRMVDALGTKLESLGFPWSSLYQKTWNNVPSNVLFFSQLV